VLTVNVKEVARVNPPPVPITVIGYEPIGAEEEAVIVQVLLHVGVTVRGLKDTTTANAMPVVPTSAERVTPWAVPERSVTIIVFEPEPPGVAVIPSLLLKLKSNGATGSTLALPI